MLNYVGLNLGFVCSVHKKHSPKWWFTGDESHGTIRKIQETDMENGQFLLVK